MISVHSDGPFDRCRLAQAQLARYRSTVNDLLPAFDELEEKASQAADAYPAGPDEDPEVTRAIEQMIESSELVVLETVRQGLLNLFAAGLFHLLEQLLANVCAGNGSPTPPSKDTKLEVVGQWYRTHFNLSVEELADWSCIDELRLVANTVKHGEGPSAEELKRRNPDLFIDYSYSGLASSSEDGSVRLPLAGGHLFVTDANLKTYSDAAEAPLAEIASHFDENGHILVVSP